MLRNKINLNYNWYFKETFNEKDLECGNYDSFKEIDIPHTLKVLPYNYFNYKDYEITSIYKRNIHIEKKENKAYLLKFLGVAQSSIYYLNGEKIKENYCGYNEIVIDITDKIIDGDNELSVVVSSKEDYFPPFGNIVDYLGYGGIYREVYLFEQNSIYISNPFLYTNHLWSETREYHLSCDINSELILSLNLRIYDGDKLIQDDTSSITNGIEIVNHLNDIEFWSPENPKLYDIVLTLLDNDQILDSLSFKFGFREIFAYNKGLFLNGKKYLLRGLDRHQAFAYQGYAMPISMQINDARILKYTLGCNAMRCSHYMNHPKFLEECDKIGLIVYEEFPGWQYIGDKAWKRQALKNLDDMILRDRNHPSIFFFGVRINESPDSKDFNIDAYVRAKELDPTRIITGTRCHKKGLDFDDCYSYNNFNNDLTQKGLEKKSKVTGKKNAYLITEYCGHMYPVKSYDNEHRRLRQARIHKNIISKVEKENDIIGATGWVFSDYNTHKCFGANDMICYHGVLDMFRNPKTASFVYSTMRNEPFLEATDFIRGDYNKSFIEPQLIFTNCERVEVYLDNELINTIYTNDSIDSRVIEYTDFIGNKLEEVDHLSHKKALKYKKLIDYTMRNNYNFVKTALRFGILTCLKAIKICTKYFSGEIDKPLIFKGYKNGELVKTIERGYSYFDHFECSLNKNELEIIDTYDVIELSVRATSNLGSTLRYMEDVIDIEVSDGLKIIGDERRSVIGGYASFYIRNKNNQASKEFIKVKSSRDEEKLINVSIVLK